MKDVTVVQIQHAITDIRSWAHGSVYLPNDPPADLLLAMADLLEQLLVERENPQLTNE